MRQRDLKYIGIALVIGGIMLFFDGLGSLLLKANYHDFWFDLERGFRMVGSFLLVILGAYFVKDTIWIYMHLCLVSFFSSMAYIRLPWNPNRAASETKNLWRGVMPHGHIRDKVLSKGVARNRL